MQAKLKTPRPIMQYLKYGAGVMLILIIALYAYLQSHALLLGPTITITSPLDGSTMATALTEIKGKAINISEIFLNDRPISVDRQGNFSEKLLLYPGYNIMTLRVKDKFGRERKKTLELVLREASSLSIN